MPDGEPKQLYLFSTQFNYFGQRTHSGVSLIDWFDNRIELKTQSQVIELELEATETQEYRCKAVHVKYLDTGETDSFFLKEGGKVILCAGAATPQLLMPHREKLNNPEIGKYVNDHMIIPLGIYLLNKNLKVTPKDNYAPIFATTVWQPETGESGAETVCTFEFFAGNFERLWFFISHLYLAFLLPNWIKKRMLQTPSLFNLYKRIRLVIEKINSWLNLWERIELITVSLKFNPVTEGEYLRENNRINLGFFEANQDSQVAKEMITQILSLMDKLGDKPHWLVRLIFWFVGIPFNKNQVNQYIERYSKRYLLSQQHLAGGCLFGKAIDKGIDNPEHTGKVYGLTNLHVADLSASPLPRVSSQMTAYLIGFHVATQLSLAKIQKTEQPLA
ncbi:MAG: hypothetical protein F6K58_05545 [Symploca sp. SIO2E9]|nr:hypothetical protein [Symploca sp. SIO2E9]